VVAIKTDGTLWAWGNSYAGAVGDNVSVKRSSPVQLGSLTDWDTIDAGTAVTAALKTDGTIWAWGRGAAYGVTGQGDLINRSSPIQIGSLTTWKSVTLGPVTMGGLKSA